MPASDEQRRMVEGFARTTKLDPYSEFLFQQAFQKYQQAVGRRMNPDDPTYDYRAAWAAGQLEPNASGHLSSQFKGLGDERVFLPIGPNGQLVDTRTARPGPNETWLGPKLDPQLINLQRLIAAAMEQWPMGQGK